MFDIFGLYTCSWYIESALCWCFDHKHDGWLTHCALAVVWYDDGMVQPSWKMFALSYNMHVSFLTSKAVVLGTSYAAHSLCRI